MLIAALAISLLALLLAAVAYARSRVAERAMKEIVTALTTPSPEREPKDPYRTL